MKRAQMREVEAIINNDASLTTLTKNELIWQTELLKDFIGSYFSGEWEDEYHNIKNTTISRQI